MANSESRSDNTRYFAWLKTLKVWLRKKRVSEKKELFFRPDRHEKKSIVLPAPSSVIVHRSGDSPTQESSEKQHVQPEHAIKRKHTDISGHLSAYTWPNPQWLVNRRRNETDSTFYGFPSELLLHIFREADFLTQLALRSTCSRFAELIASLDVKRAQNPQAQESWRLQIWPRHGTEEQRLAVRQQWATLIRRDRTDLCKHCEAFEQSGQLDKAIKKLGRLLWCAYCEAYHSRGMFSSSQRRRWRYYRMCIGWEGRLQLCPHVSYSWSQVQTQNHQADVRRQQGKKAAHLVVRCSKKCHWPGSYNSFWPNEPTRCKLDNKYCTWVTDLDGPVPKLAATWANHVFDIDLARPLTRHTFREALEKLETGSDGPSLCPHVSFDDGKLLIPFQPGFCCCFSDTLEPGYKFNQHSHISCSPFICRCRTESSPNPERKTISAESYHGGFSHPYNCNECGAIYLWRRRQNTIHLQYFNRIESESAFATLWIKKLDPHSWNITTDVETRHVYWCPDGNCRTNYRWRAFYRRLWIYNS